MHLVYNIYHMSAVQTGRYSLLPKALTVYTRKRKKQHIGAKAKGYNIPVKWYFLFTSTLT